ncbi:MAG: heparinase II/III family protein [Clostridiaceae bacterium]
MKGRFIRILSKALVFALVFTLLSPLANVAFAASNLMVVDDFPTGTLSGWTKNAYFSNMQTSTTAYEGAYSLQLDYVNIKDITAYAKKAMNSVNASSCQGVSFRIKGPNTTQYYTVRITSKIGTQYYYWDTEKLSLGKNDWKRVFLPWSYFRNRNDTAQVATASNMAQVTEFRFDVVDVYQTAAATSGTVYLDDIKFVDDRVDDFEGGIDYWSGDTYTTAGSETGAGNYYEGSKSMKCTYDFGTQPNGTKSAVTKTFSSIVDVKEFNGVSVWIKGDNSGNTLSASIHTTNGDYTFETRPVTINFSGWEQYVFFWKRLYRDSYVMPTSTDLEQIDKVSFNIIKQGTASSSIYVDSALFTQKSDIFTNLNLNLPGLSTVKSYVDNCDYESAKESLLSYMRNRTNVTYFFNWADKTSIMNEFVSNYPEAIDNVILSADKAKDYDFNFEGDHRQLDPDGDNDIDWYQGTGVFGLMLPRMGWWLDQGKAFWNSFLNTPDESYVTEFTACLRDFIEDSPPPYAINNFSGKWTPTGNLWRSIEIGMRLDNYNSAYAFFLNSSSFTAEDNYLFLQSLFDNAESLYNFEAAYIDSNWQIFECYGLYSISVMFPEFLNAANWKSVSKYYLEQHMANDIGDDGFHNELTFNYHESMIDLLRRAKTLGEMNSDTFSQTYSDKLDLMFEVVMKMMRSNGYEPMFCDACSYSDRTLMALGAGIFGRGDFKYLSNNVVSATDFWTTPASVRSNLANLTATSPDFTSTRLDDARYYAMRTQWRDGGNSLYFDGAPYNYGHWHHDQMNIDVTSNGFPIILDPGRGNYSDFDYYDNFFRRSASHNTITMDTYENPYHVTPVENSWVNDTDYDYIDSKVDYTALTSTAGDTAAPYQLERKIYFAKPDYFIMNDIITPTISGTHDYEQKFHFAPSAIHIDAATKAVEVNNYIDNFEINSLADYSTKPGYCTITNTADEKYEGLRGLKVDYDLALGYTWFKKTYSYNAQHMGGIVFYLKGDSSSNTVKPYFLTSSGNWLYSEGISLNYSGWKEFYLPWKLFCKESDQTRKMGPNDASNITAVDFHIYGSGTGMVYFDKIRFYDNYDVANFESKTINDFEDESIAGWSAGQGTIAIDTTQFYQGSKSLKLTCSYSDSTPSDYVRKVQNYDASKLAGVMVAVKGNSTKDKFYAYVSTSTGLFRLTSKYASTGTYPYTSDGTYIMSYGDWRVYYFPWRNFYKESDPNTIMTASDAKYLNYMEFHFDKGSTSTNNNPAVYIDKAGFFDYYQEKSSVVMELEGWTPTNAAISLDGSNKFEGDYSMKIDYDISGENTQASIVNAGDIYYGNNELYDGISLRLKGNGNTTNKLKLLMNSYISPEISLAGTDWTYVYIPWSDFKLEKDMTTVMGAPVVKTLELRVSKNGGSSTGTINVDNITFIGSDRPNITVVPADPDSISDVATDYVWISYNTSRYESAPYITYKKTGIKGNTAFDTVMVPGITGMSPSVAVSRLNVTQNGSTLSNTEASGLQITINDNVHTYTDYYLTSHNRTNYAKKYGEFYYDGSKAYIRETDGTVTREVYDTDSTLFEYLDIDDFESGAITDWTRNTTKSTGFNIDLTTTVSSYASSRFDINYPSGSDGTAYTWVRKDPSTSIDASDCDGVRFWVKGNNTGYKLKPIIQTNYDSQTRLFYYGGGAPEIVLNFDGWKQYFLPWSSFGNLPNYLTDLQSVDFFQIQVDKYNSSNPDTGSVNFDQIFFSSGGNSVYSKEASATPPVAAPVLQSAVAGDGHVNITWSEVTDSTEYKIYASTASNSYTSPVATVTGPAYSYDVTELTNGTAYYFAVKAVHPRGDTAYSNEVSATPQIAAPVIDTAVAGNRHVSLSWNPVAGAGGYTVYAGTAPGSYNTATASVAGSVYSCDFTGLTNGSTYYFAVKAVSAGSESTYSNEVSAIPQVVAPVLQSAVAGDGHVSISWNPSAGAGGYIAYAGTASGSYDTAAVSVTGSVYSYDFTGLTNGMTYYFAVAALPEYADIDDFESGVITDWTRNTSKSTGFVINTTTAAVSATSSEFDISYPQGSDGTVYTWVRKDSAGSIDASDSDGVKFWVKGNNTGYKVRPIIQTAYGGQTRIFYYNGPEIVLNYDGWNQYFLPWSSFGSLTDYLTDLQLVDFFQFEVTKYNSNNSDTGSVNFDQISFSLEGNSAYSNEMSATPTGR